MATKPSNQKASGETPAPSGASASLPIKAVKLRHPWRWLVATAILLYTASFIWDAAVNRPVYDWATFGKYVFDKRISEAALVTLELTVCSMVIAITLGIVLAVMRLSPNPVYQSLSWFYLWVFRGTPVYVQLVFWGLISAIYPTFALGLPFGPAWLEIKAADVPLFWISVIGLALNEAAYMAEVVRAGILSVDKGQTEASTALGMSWFQTMKRVVIPQSMRIIIPPTGNEVISMLKTTSLVAAVPFGLDLYMRTRDIAGPLFKPIPLLLVASAWYLLFTSVLMVGQHYLEKRYSRGTGFEPVRKPKRGTTAGEVSA